MELHMQQQQCLLGVGMITCNILQPFLPGLDHADDLVQADPSCKAAVSPQRPSDER